MIDIKPKKFLSIKSKITLSIFSFVIFTLGIIFTVSFFSIKNDLQSDLKNHLLSMASISSLQINGQEHSMLMDRSDENTPEYRDIKYKLKKIRDASPDISYIYTLRSNENGDITFVVDAEENPDKVSHLGDVYTDANQFLIDNFKTINKPITESFFTSDKWGTWISGYAPFYDDSGVKAGVLGIDIDATSVIKKEQGIFINYLLIFILCGVFSIFLGLRISKKLTKSIIDITNNLKNNNSTNIEYNDEVGDLAETIKDTVNVFSSAKKESDEKLTEKMKILERTNKLMVGRELEMIKLKKEIIDLKNKENNNN